MSMLPAATSCSSGFHRWVRLRSMSVTSARPLRASRSPSRVASSSPPAPPPAMTMRCSAPTLFLGDGLAAEEELGPELAEAVPVVEHDRRVDQPVAELVERAVDRAARGNPVARLDDLLALAREDELGEERRGVRVRRLARDAHRARLPEGRVERAPVDGRALLLQARHALYMRVECQV